MITNEQVLDLASRPEYMACPKLSVTLMSRRQCAINHATALKQLNDFRKRKTGLPRLSGLAPVKIQCFNACARCATGRRNQRIYRVKPRYDNQQF